MLTSQQEYRFQHSNASVPSPASLKSGFSISAAPGTDIWAKPPDTTRFNAPLLHRTAFPLSRFRRARVNVRAHWQTLYDQGGLLLALWDDDGGDGAGSGREVDAGKEAKWVKTGIEFFNGRARVSTVARDEWADWSLASVPGAAAAGQEGDGGDDGPGVTVEMIREKDNSLWVFVLDGDEKVPVREITWAFAREDGKECWIGAYAARPNKESGGPLDVKFAGLEIETLDT